MCDSVGWLRLLHHCLYEGGGQMADDVALAAAPTPHLLATCTALMLSPGASGFYDRNIEQVGSDVVAPKMICR